MLTKKQSELLWYIHEETTENGGVSPSFEEMMYFLCLKSKSGVHRIVKALEERGFISRIPNRARAITILRMPNAKHDKRPR